MCWSFRLLNQGYNRRRLKPNRKGQRYHTYEKTKYIFDHLWDYHRRWLDR